MIDHKFNPKRPWTLLPMPPPQEYDPTTDYGEDFFYENVGKALIKTTNRIINTGLPIDLSKVGPLEDELTRILSDVDSKLANNKVIQDFYQWKYPKLLEEHQTLYQSKLHTADKYLKPFDVSKIEHRSYYMYCYIKANPDRCYDVIEPLDRLPTGIPKWTVNNIKKILHHLPDVECLISKTNVDKSIADQSMQLLAEHRAKKANEQYDYYTKLNQTSIKDIVPKFNPGSSAQKHELLTDMLNYESDTLSDAYRDWEKLVRDNSRRHIHTAPDPPKNKYSWSRDEIEKLQKQIPDTDPLYEVLQCFIDHSFAAIVKNNFVSAFYRYTINDRLHPGFNLFGAKTARYTCSKP